MENINDVVKLAVDSCKGNVKKYSNEEAQDTLRRALIEANNGKTALNYRDIRDGKCNGLFAILEEVIKEVVIDGLQGDEYFNALVDFRNVAIGDKNLFVVEDSNLFVVADTAEGTQGVRRQRLGGAKEVAIPTTFKTVRIYEELNRVLAGRVDFNDFIAKVSESFRRKMLDDIYAAWSGVTATDIGGASFFVAAGSYDEETLLALIEHVEAAAGGKPATIICTKAGARALTSAIISDSAKEDLYHTGVYGYFYGTPIIATPQRHKVGSANFVFDDKVITIVAGDQKPIKVVVEGDPLIIQGDPTDNADLTVEYFVGERYGVGIVVNSNNGLGRYELPSN